MLPLLPLSDRKKAAPTFSAIISVMAARCSESARSAASISAGRFWPVAVAVPGASPGTTIAAVLELELDVEISAAMRFVPWP